MLNYTEKNRCQAITSYVLYMAKKVLIRGPTIWLTV